MAHFLSEPWWGFIGVVTGAILSVIAIYISIKQNKRKKLSYYIPYLYPLIDINKNAKKDFQIRYKGEIIEQVCITEIILENTGGVPIKKEDFDEPLKIEITNCSHIFNVELVDVTPEHLIVGLDIKSNSNTILINPLLLNPKDLIRLKVIFEGEKSIVKIISRIVDLPSIKDKNENTQYKKKFYAVVTIILGFTIYYFSPIPFLDLIGPILIGVGISFVSDALINTLKKVRR